MNTSDREALHRKASDAEQVVVVDELDRPIGAVARARLRAEKLIGRGTFIFLFNSQGQLCVHQRTTSKALYPGYWDVCAGGMVAVGETYEQAAKRELAEELGVSETPLVFHGTVRFNSDSNRLWCGVFSAVSDQALTLQAEEVQQAVFIDPQTLTQWLDQHAVCPDSLTAMLRVPRLSQYF